MKIGFGARVQSIAKVYRTAGGGAVIPAVDWDLTSASYSGTNYTAVGGLGQCLVFNDDGTKLFIDNSANLLSGTLSTPYDLSTLGSLTTSSLAGTWGFSISRDGLHVYMGVNESGQVRYYTLSTAWDLSTADSGQLVQVASTTPLTYATANVYITNDGATFCTAYADKIYEYPLGTNYDLTTIDTGSVVTHTITTPISSYVGQFIIKSDGTQLIFADKINERAYLQDLSTPFDLSTATHNSSVALTGQISNGNVNSILVDSTLQKFWCSNRSNGTVFEYNMNVGA